MLSTRDSRDRDNIESTIELKPFVRLSVNMIGVGLEETRSAALVAVIAVGAIGCM